MRIVDVGKIEPSVALLLLLLLLSYSTDGSLEFINLSLFHM